MRNLKQLYQLLLDEFDNIPVDGICLKIEYSEMFHEEMDFLDNDFQNRKIKWWSKFYWNDSFRGQQGFWWTNNEKGNKQRKLYLQHIINSL